MPMDTSTTLAPTDARDRGGPRQPLLIVRNLRKHFPIRSGVLGRVSAHVRAVDGVSFTVMKGETLGIVGESGCGKSTVARLLMRLLTPDGGEHIFDGEAVGEAGGISVAEMRRQVQMVFQDSASSLNPRMPVQGSVAFGPIAFGTPRDRALAQARQLLAKVGLDPVLFGGRYPHELSGGQKQRVNVARALALDPRMVILDEAVSALDKSIEAQVLNLLQALRRELQLTYVFISHDLSVVRWISDRVMVMYLGEVVEIGPSNAIYEAPKHPYTRALLASRPALDPDNRRLEAPVSGDPPSPINPPSGCRFHTRCPFAEPVCSARAPALGEGDVMAHLAACHMQDAASGHSQAVQGLRH
jgi:peptide/nickel transport system ATP-binding protein